MGYRQLREIHRHPFQVAELFIRPFQDHPVVTVGVAAGDQRCAVDTARRRDRQRVHVGHRAAVKLAGGVLVDGFDVIVELDDIDLDAVFAGPFINDLFVTDGSPGHPAGVDGPADVELFFDGGKRRDAGQQRQRQDK